MSREIVDAMRQIARERDLEIDELARAACDGMLVAYRQLPDADPEAEVTLDLASGEFRVVRADHKGVEVELTPPDFGRLAAHAARRVIGERVSQLEQEQLLEHYRTQVGQLVVGTVQASTARATLIDLGRATASLDADQRLPHERFGRGASVRAVLTRVSAGPDGVDLRVSRKHHSFVSALIRDEVPEVESGLVVIGAVARAPGVRAKVGVTASQAGIDPVGALIGPRGARVRPISRELGGEPVDVVRLDDAPERMLARALQPARVREVIIDDPAERRARIVVAPAEMGKALGQKGINARLAAQLTGWNIKIMSAETHDRRQGESRDAEGGDGRCVARLDSGKRCPNAVVAGGRYCGIARHAALAASQ